MESKVLMLIWTIITTANPSYGTNPVAVSQTSTEVTSAVCEKVKQMPSQVKLPSMSQTMAITVLCVPINKN